jgi:hypothetical protein
LNQEREVGSNNAFGRGLCACAGAGRDEGRKPKATKGNPKGKRPKLQGHSFPLAHMNPRTSNISLCLYWLYPMGRDLGMVFEMDQSLAANQNKSHTVCVVTTVVSNSLFKWSLVASDR